MFSGCHGLVSLTLPKSITTVRSDAFNNCRGVTSLTLPDSITSIGMNAFWGFKRLTSLTLPPNVTNVSAAAFGYCTSLTSVNFRPRVPVSAVFIAWAVGNSRHRDNWQLTTLMQLRNVLRLITVMAFKRRKLYSIASFKSAFVGCTALRR